MYETSNEYPMWQEVILIINNIYLNQELTSKRLVIASYIAHKMKSSTNCISKILSYIEKKGLIMRKIKGKLRIITITEKGIIVANALSNIKEVIGEKND